MVRNIVLTGLTIALLTGCSSKKEENQKTETADAIPVKVMKLEKRNIAKTLDYTATLQADEQVYYAPEYLFYTVILYKKLIFFLI